MSVRSAAETASAAASAAAPRLEAVRAKTRQEEATGVARGGRLPHEKSAFDRQRKERLTASLLPFWVKLQGASRKSYDRDTIVRVLNYNNGTWKRPPLSNRQSEGIVQEIINYGVFLEPVAIAAYMDVTRIAVALGSVRTRDRLLQGDSPVFMNNQESFEWSELLCATPDGLIFDAMAKEGNNAFKTGRGLLEVTCPAAIQKSPQPPYVQLRHDPDMHHRFETKTYQLLQAWQQLEVVREAEFVDLVAFKRDTYNRDFLWIARLYRHESHQTRIKNALVDSFSEFQRAMKEIDDGDATMDEDGELSFLADNASGMAQGQLNLPNYTANEMRSSERKELRDALAGWTEFHLKFRNCDESERSAGFPWRSVGELKSKGKPTTFLANRYEVGTGAVATHETPTVLGRANYGYTPLRPTAAQLFYREHFDEGQAPPAPAARANQAAGPSGQPMHIFDAGSDLAYNYAGKVCIRCGMVCEMRGVVQNWVDRGNTNPSAVCYGARYGTAWRELNRQQGGDPRRLAGRQQAAVVFDDDL